MQQRNGGWGALPHAGRGHLGLRDQAGQGDKAQPITYQQTLLSNGRKLLGAVCRRKVEQHGDSLFPSPLLLSGFSD